MACWRRASVHPRVRGEQACRVSGIRPCAGSSPRARGTGERGGHGRAFLRFIPACAGNRSCTRAAWPVATVHPRVRGEQVGAGPGKEAVTGSSPRARGTEPGVNLHGAEQRFIPACAGNSTQARQWLARFAVHPRVRGEQTHAFMAAMAEDGSSPRARGTETCLPLAVADARFIPACAGNRSPRPPPAAPAPVHPRVRGEQPVIGLLSESAAGSSPRARGTGASEPRRARGRRFIPACAGNSSTASSTAAPAPVHPRVRGEQRTAINFGVGECGSSPRARGTVTGPECSDVQSRFIPACAGNRVFHCVTDAARAVHPRVRGEQSHKENRDLTLCGSSPRARGTAPVQ